MKRSPTIEAAPEPRPSPDTDGGGAAIVQGVERRKFKRFSAGMALEVTTRCSDGTDWAERTRTVDVSGEGMKFSSSDIGRYRKDQAVVVKVPLPAAGESGAEMTGTGRVVRVNSGTSGKTCPCRGEVAIQLAGPLRFSRTGGQTAPNSPQDPRQGHEPA